MKPIIYRIASLLISLLCLGYFAFYKTSDSSNSTFYGFLTMIVFVNYRGYASRLTKEKTLEKINQKRIKKIISVFILVWGVLFFVKITNNYILFSEFRWSKTVLHSLGIVILLTTVGILIAEYSLLKELNKKPF